MRRLTILVLLLLGTIALSGDDQFRVQVLKTWTESPRSSRKEGRYLQNRVRELGSGREYVLYCWEPKATTADSPCYPLQKGQTYSAKREKRSTYISVPHNGAPVWAEYIESTNDFRL